MSAEHTEGPIEFQGWVKVGEATYELEAKASNSTAEPQHTDVEYLSMLVEEGKQRGEIDEF